MKNLMMRNLNGMGMGLLIVALLVVGIVVPSGPASADVYTLNVDYCTTGCLNGGTGGTVTVTQNGVDDVLVSVSLSGVAFHSTAAFTSFTFDLSGNPTISVANLTSGFLLVSTTAGSLHQDGAGFFEYGVDQTLGPPGFSGVTTLSFDVIATGLTPGSFAELSTGGSPSAFFSVSVYNLENNSCTGVIGADGGTTPTNGGSNTGTGACGGSQLPVPEPASLLLLGSGLVGLGLLRRRKV